MGWWPEGVVPKGVTCDWILRFLSHKGQNSFKVKKIGIRDKMRRAGRK